MRLIDADAISYESIDSCDTGRHEHYYGTGIIAVRKEDIDEMPTIHPEPHWIPCSEGLPKEEGFYLVTLEDKCGAETTIRLFRIENGERHWSLWGNENITAWMPMPESFKGVTE